MPQPRTSPPDEHRGHPWWMNPSGDVAGIPRYLEMVRSGRWIIVGALVLCVGAAALYLANASKVYEASADVLVIPQSDLLVPVPGIVQASSDPTRDVETVARLVDAPSVSQRVIRGLRLDTNSQALQRKISVDPVAQSNIVTITAREDSPAAAKRLADAYGEAFITDRTERLHDTLDAFIGRLEPAVRAAGDAGSQSDTSPAAQLAFLRYLRQGPDPSVRLESRAELPTSAVSPRPLLTLVAAVLAGLVIGLVGALGVQLLDPRLRREEDLRARFSLPILARIPLERGRRRRPLLPSEMSLAALDGFQALRVALNARDSGTSLNGRVILVTGPTPGDGKTTAAVNLASTLAAAGKRVILIEADSRRPAVGRALDLETTVGLSGVVTGRHYLVDALIPVGSEDSKLRVVLNAADEAPAADVLSSVAADTLMLQARRLADWVIVDAPPLNHVAETLALAGSVDDVLIVVRVGGTNNRDLTELAETLGQQRIEPAGFVVFGGHARTSYY